MATAPIKSQPLHNFSLPHLRWAHKTPQQPPPPHSTVHPRDSPDFNPPENDAAKPSSRNPRKSQPFYSSSSFTSFGSASHQNHKVEENDAVLEEGEKPWNLRPRKVPTSSTSRKSEKEKEKLQDETESYLRNNNYSNETVLLKSRVRGGTAVMVGLGEVGGIVGPPGFCGTERQQRKAGLVEEKRRLWISLSKEEIEEDVYSLTGSRPSRRPNKRPRTLQKHLDNVFPGLYLVGMNIDSFRAHDSLR